MSGHDSTATPAGGCHSPVDTTHTRQKSPQKGEWGEYLAPKTSATPLPRPLIHSGIEYQMYTRQGPSNQTMKKAAGKSGSGCGGQTESEQGEMRWGRIQQRCKYPRTGDTHHPRPSPSLQLYLLCGVFFFFPQDLPQNLLEPLMLSSHSTMAPAQLESSALCPQNRA